MVRNRGMPSPPIPSTLSVCVQPNEAWFKLRQSMIFLRSNKSGRIELDPRYSAEKSRPKIFQVESKNSTLMSISVRLKEGGRGGGRGSALKTL